MEKTFTKAKDLLNQAKQNGVNIILNEDQLQLKFPENKNINKELLADLHHNKKLIIRFLKEHKSAKNYIEITRFNRKNIEHIPLSFNQERLWFVDELESNVLHNWAMVM